MGLRHKYPGYQDFGNMSTHRGTLVVESREGLDFASGTYADSLAI